MNRNHRMAAIIMSAVLTAPFFSLSAQPAEAASFRDMAPGVSRASETDTMENRRRGADVPADTVLTGHMAAVKEAVASDSEAVESDPSVTIDGTLLDLGDNGRYKLDQVESASSAKDAVMAGNLSITGKLGALRSSSDADGNTVPSYRVVDGGVTFSYVKDAAAFTEDEDGWTFSEDKADTAAGVSLPDAVGSGVILVQTSQDGADWSTEKILTDVFSSGEGTPGEIFITSEFEQLNAFYFRVLVLYQKEKAGTEKIGPVSFDAEEQKNFAEVYEFRLKQSTDDMPSSDEEPAAVLTPSGSARRSDADQGFPEDQEIGSDDVHAGWDIGEFYLNGYTEAVDASDQKVFLTDPGSGAVLWFRPEQDIDRLNQKTSLSVADSSEGYDERLGVEKGAYRFGRGTLILRRTDALGNAEEPQVITDFLKSADGKTEGIAVAVLEEGDYEAALDYEIENEPLREISLPVGRSVTGYRVSFSFSVRSNSTGIRLCDLDTGAELGDFSLTERGFGVDTSENTFQKISITRYELNSSEDGLVESGQYRMPSEDTPEYTEEGVYVLASSDPYTGEKSEKTVCVGDNDILRAYTAAQGKMKISTIKKKLASGYTVDGDGALAAPSKTGGKGESVTGSSLSGSSDLEDENVSGSSESSFLSTFGGKGGGDSDAGGIRAAAGDYRFLLAAAAAVIVLLILILHGSRKHRRGKTDGAEDDPDEEEYDSGSYDPAEDDDEEDYQCDSGTYSLEDKEEEDPETDDGPGMKQTTETRLKNDDNL